MNSIDFSKRYKQIVNHVLSVLKDCSSYLSPSYGPNGGYKLIKSDKRNFSITKDGKQIINEIRYISPIYNLITGTVNGFSNIYGDGIKKMIIISYWLLKGGIELIDLGVSPNRIVKVYEKCLRLAINELNEISNEGGEKEIKMNIMTVLNGIERNLAETLSNKIIELDIFKTEPQIEYFQNKKSTLKIIQGAVVYNGECHYNNQNFRNDKRKKLLLFNVPLNTKQRLSGKKIIFIKKNVNDSFLYINDFFKNFIMKEDICCIFNGKNIDERLKRLLERNGIFSMKTVPKKFLEYLQRATMAEIIHEPSKLSSSSIGEVTDIYTENFKGSTLVIIENKNQRRQFCIKISHFTEYCDDYYKHEVEKALKVAKIADSNREFVPGGGSTELILAKKCKENYKGSNDYLIAEKFCNALEEIPKILIRNSGNKKDWVVKYIQSNSEESPTYGVDESGNISDMMLKGVLESSFIFSKILQSSVQLASGLLKIDNILVLRK